MLTVIVNLSKHCAEIIMRLYILLPFIRFIIPAIFRLRGRRTKGWGRETNLSERDPIEPPCLLTSPPPPTHTHTHTLSKPAMQAKLHIQTSEKVLRQHSNEGRRGKGENVPAMKWPN